MEVGGRDWGKGIWLTDDSCWLKVTDFTLLELLDFFVFPLFLAFGGVGSGASSPDVSGISSKAKR